MSWEKTDAKTLRVKLREKCGLTKEDADNIKGKKNLVREFVDRGLNYDDVFNSPGEMLDAKLDEAVLESNVDDKSTIDKEKVSDEEVVRYGGPNWSDYVLSLFKEDELVDGHPKLAGLRRISEKLLGKTVFSGPISVQPYYPADPMEPGRATVTYKVVIEFGLDIADEWISEEQLMGGKFPERVFSAVAGAYMGNTDEEFRAYPEAIAESRAEARAYRKALLIDTVTHEEISDTAKTSVREYLENRENEVTGEYDENSQIEASQINAVKVISKRLDISPEKLSSNVLGKDFDEKLTRKDGQELMKKLNKYQSNHDKSESVPEEVKV